MQMTISMLKKLTNEGQKIASLTCYDYSFARVLDESGVDVLLVGDSLGMTIHGYSNTLAVTLKDMIYHTSHVARGASRAMVLADLSFGSYQKNTQQAFDSAAQLMRVGANMVKLEGGATMAATLSFLVERGIPVCGHIGLTPQSVNCLGGYVVQGKDKSSEQRLLADAKALDEAGASMIVLECIPASLAKQITDTVSCATIGIGAGADCDGQVLVLQDILGIGLDKKTRFSKNFMNGAESIHGAVAAYVYAVKSKTFPDAAHSF